jgi:GT2 family glycosyltransferase
VSTVIDQLRALGFDHASVSSAATPGIYRIRYHRPPKGKIAIVIPTHNSADLVKQALESIARTVPDHLYHIVLVDHASDEQKSLDYFSSLSNSHQVLRFEGAFNFSSINNYAVSQLDPAYESILFLNNDVEAIREGWLESMHDKLRRHDVGIVGAVLLYPDQTIQHAGVILGLGVADHYLKRETYRDPYNFRQTPNNIPAVVTRDFSAVTAACLMIKRDLFDAIGGFDEQLAVGFGDVELCLKARQKDRKVICDGEAVLIHHESISRDVDTPYDPHPMDTAEFRLRYGNYISGIDGLMHGKPDPFYHPLLSTGGYCRPVRGAVRSYFVTPRLSTSAGIAPLVKRE